MRQSGEVALKPAAATEEEEEEEKDDEEKSRVNATVMLRDKLCKSTSMLRLVLVCSFFNKINK